ncbi:T9SS type A sorting domain-containing protein [Candidatus Neomarinimicrobiota bacterium]
MSRRLTIGIALSLILGIASFVFITDDAISVLVGSGPGLADSQLSVEKAKSKSSRKLKGPVSERKQSVKGLAKLDRPDLFAQYHRDIRTRHGEAAPSYPFNYQVEAVLKAKKLSSTKALAKTVGSTEANWVERGPGNVSGRTRGLIVDPDDPNFDTWYAGSVGGGVWKTENAGQSWTELTSDLPNLAIGWLAMAPSNHDVIYAGTGEGFINVDQMNGSGIWKTTDRGQTWGQLASTGNLEFQNVTRIIVDPADEDILLVTTSVGFGRAPTTSGVHRSTDGGLTWSKVYDSGAHTVDQIIVDPGNFDIQYASVNSVGVIKSTDGGVNWADASEGLGPITRMELAIAPSATSKLYLSSPGGSAGSVLYISDDAGANWVQGSDTTGNVNWLGGQGWYDNTIAVNPYDATELFVGGIDLWKMNIGTGIDTTAFQVTGIDEENTSAFLSYVNFGGALMGGGIDFGEAEESEYTSIEVRFGPGISQKAHRFLVPEGSTSGVTDANYTYQDYVDVPFELWDIDNNVQLMISFRDQSRNGVWELEPYDADIPPREYVFLSAEPYNPTTPSSLIGQNGGHANNQLYFLWPVLTDGGTFDRANMPEATLRIGWGRSITTNITTTNVTDGYGQYEDANTNVHVDHHNIVLVPTNESTGSYRLVNANDGGVSFSDDAGGSFEQPLNGYNTTQFYGVDKKNDASEYIGGMQDNSTWRSPAGIDADASSQWTFQTGGDGFECVWHYNDPSKLLASSQFNSIYRSLDGGATWSSAVNGMEEVENGSPFFTKLAKSKQDPDLIFAVGQSGVWRADNFASNWTLTQMPAGWNGTSSFSAVKISLVNPQIVWAGSDMLQERSVYVSTDGGLTFAETAGYSAVVLGRISGLETHPTEDSTAFALFSFANAPKLLRTTDLGQTWVELSGFGTGATSTNGFPDVALYSLLVMPYDPDIIWAGTEIGIFESLDGGATWADANNGFPPTAVYEMLIVNDQVVVATHGRGVWSVTLAELAGYEPLAATLSPRFNELAGGAGGTIHATVGLKSVYDSSFVFVDNVKTITFGANAAALDTAINFNLTADSLRTVSFSLISYKDGTTYKSAATDLDIFPLLAALESYSNNFNISTSDFMFSGLLASVETGFVTPTIHSPHPYPDRVDLTATLLVPIIMTSEHAAMSYVDVALIEPGEEGASFGDADFWDYAMVEGSIDNGASWVPFDDGYDARLYPAWLTAYDNGEDGTYRLLKSHVINFPSEFSAGDQVIVRFRLFADAYTNGWGWAIDNLVIVPGSLTLDPTDAIPTAFSLSQNYPNPFNPTTKINYTLPKTSAVKLQIFNLLGQRVRDLINNKSHTAGFHTIVWDGKDDLGRDVSSGLYIYRLEASGFVKTHKMMMLK